MRPSKTTIYGTGAALCFAAGQVPTLPPWLTTSFDIGAALSMAMLGRHAADCPPNCPGTDANGRPPEDPRQRKLGLFPAALVLVVAVGVLGCVTPNPELAQGNTNAPPFVISPGLPAASNAAVQIAAEVGDLTKTGPLLPMLVVGVFTAVGAISGLVANHRNQAKTLAALQGSRAQPAKNPIDAPPDKS